MVGSIQPEDGRLDIDVLKDQLAQDGLILSKLGGKIPYRNGNGLSRIVFTATITKATTVRHPGEANSPVFLYIHIDMVQCCAISRRQHLQCDCLCAQCILQHQHESTSSMQVGSLHKLIINCNYPPAKDRWWPLSLVH